MPGDLVEDAATEPVPLMRRQHMQLGELERLGHPTFAELRPERVDDDVVPPLAASAEIAVAEGDRLAALVIVIECDDGDETAAGEVGVHDLATLDDHLGAALHGGTVDVRCHLDVRSELVRTEHLDAHAHDAPTSAGVPPVRRTSSS